MLSWSYNSLCSLKLSLRNYKMSIQFFFWTSIFFKFFSFHRYQFEYLARKLYCTTNQNSIKYLCISIGQRTWRLNYLLKQYEKFTHLRLYEFQFLIVSYKTILNVARRGLPFDRWSNDEWSVVITESHKMVTIYQSFNGKLAQYNLPSCSSTMGLRLL